METGGIESHRRVRHIHPLIQTTDWLKLASVCQTVSSVAAASDVSLTVTGALMCTVH